MSCFFRSARICFHALPKCSCWKKDWKGAADFPIEKKYGYYEEAFGQTAELLPELNKALRAAHSRRETDRLVAEGRVLVNGERAVAGVRLARGEPVRALDTGGDVVLKADSVCVHGDKPSAVAQAKAVRDALVGAGFELVGLPEVVVVE